VTEISGFTGFAEDDFCVCDSLNEINIVGEAPPCAPKLIAKADARPLDRGVSRRYHTEHISVFGVIQEEVRNTKHQGGGNMGKKMKVLAVTGLFLALAVPAVFAVTGLNIEGYREISVKTDTVTVYQQNAFVERKGLINLLAGENKLVISGLPPEMIEDTLLVYKPEKSAPYIVKEFEYRDIQVQVDLTGKVREIGDRLQVLRAQLAADQDNISVMDDKVKFLRGLTAKSTDEISKQLLLKDIDVKSTEELLKLITAGVQDALTKKRVLLMDVEKLNNEKTALESQLAGIQAGGTKTVKILSISVDAVVAGSFQLGVKYVVQGAGWTPCYESNLAFTTGKIETKMFAKITQYTSEKWDDVKLIIATGSPAFDSTLPELQAWVIDQMREQYRQAYGYAPETVAAGKNKVMAEAKDEQEAVLDANRVENVKFSEINMQMQIKDRYNVQNGGVQKKVYIKEYGFDVKERFYTVVPSYNTMAYLTASFINDSKEVLLPGTVTLYLDDNYSGKAELTANIDRGEEVKFSYGTDENIKVEKERLTSKTANTGIFGLDKKIDYGYKITMKNYKEKAVTLYVKEPVPVSALDKIKVDFYEESVKHDNVDDRNIYLWKIDLKAGEKKELVYRFSVTFPKDMNVTGI
jgi:uncharacterized protein (TIGR02231 family)